MIVIVWLVGTTLTAGADGKKFTCYFKASGAGNGAFLRIEALSTIEAEKKTIAHIKRVIGNDVEIFAVDCR